MITEPQLDLLADLAKLLRKHGPETFEALAASMSSPEAMQRLADLLMSAAKVARKPSVSTGSAKGRSRGRWLYESLAPLRSSEPEKYEMLNRFYDSVLAKTILPSLRDLRRFAEESGFGELKGRSREECLNSLIEALRHLSVEDLKARTGGVVRRDYKSDRSLQGWSDLILGNRQSD